MTTITRTNNDFLAINETVEDGVIIRMTVEVIGVPNDKLDAVISSMEAMRDMQLTLGL